MDSEERGSRDWVAEAQAFLENLKDIIDVGITLTEDATGIAEINVLAEGKRAPKQIVRDVRSALKAKYGREVDYRKISIAQKQGAETARASAAGDEGPRILALPRGLVREEPASLRLRFGGLSVSIGQNTCRVRVELSLGDRETIGEATGASARGQVPRLIAEATLLAVTRFLDEVYTLVLGDVEVIRVGDEEVVIVVAKFYKDRSEMVLSGSCHASHDLHQSVVYATLSALNRILGRVRYQEPVEYEIRPTSIL